MHKFLLFIGIMLQGVMYGMQQQNDISTCDKKKGDSDRITEYIIQKKYSELLDFLYTVFDQNNTNSIDKAIFTSLTIIESMIDRCASEKDLQIADRDLCSYALLRAISLNHFEASKLLIARGADVNFKFKNDAEVVTPLGIAVKKSHPELVEFLLMNKANPNQLHEESVLIDMRVPGSEKKGVMKEVPLSLLSFCENWRITKLLLEFMDPSLINRLVPLTPVGIIDAIFGSGSLKNIYTTFDMSQKALARSNFRGGCPLHHITRLALASEDVTAYVLNLVTMINSKKVDMKAVDSDGNTLLHLLSEVPGFQSRVMKKLCAYADLKEYKGIPVKETLTQLLMIKNNHGNTPLHSALENIRSQKKAGQKELFPDKEDVENVVQLIELGSMLNDRNKSGYSCVDMIVEKGLVSSLIEAQAIKKDMIHLQSLQDFLAQQSKNTHDTKNQSSFNTERFRETIHNYEKLGFSLYTKNNYEVSGVDCLNPFLKNKLQALQTGVFSAKKNPQVKKNNNKNRKKKRNKNKKRLKEAVTPSNMNQDKNEISVSDQPTATIPVSSNEHVSIVENSSKALKNNSEVLSSDQNNAKATSVKKVRRRKKKEKKVIMLGDMQYDPRVRVWHNPTQEFLKKQDENSVKYHALPFVLHSTIEGNGTCAFHSNSNRNSQDTVYTSVILINGKIKFVTLCKGSDNKFYHCGIESFQAIDKYPSHVQNELKQEKKTLENFWSMYGSKNRPFPMTKFTGNFSVNGEPNSNTIYYSSNPKRYDIVQAYDSINNRMITLVNKGQ